LLAFILLRLRQPASWWSGLSSDRRKRINFCNGPLFWQKYFAVSCSDFARLPRVQKQIYISRKTFKKIHAGGRLQQLAQLYLAGLLVHW
jgi:hypothetical protein